MGGLGGGMECGLGGAELRGSGRFMNFFMVLLGFGPDFGEGQGGRWTLSGCIELFELACSFCSVEDGWGSGGMGNGE